MRMFKRIAAAMLVLCFSGALFAKKTPAERQASCRNIVTATLLARDSYAPYER